MNEITNKISLCVADLIIEKVCENEISVPHLLSSKEISETNFACITSFVNSYECMITRKNIPVSDRCDYIHDETLSKI